MWLAAQVLVVPWGLVERTFSKSVARISVLRAPGPPMIAPATHDTDRTTTSGSEKMIIKDDGKVGVGTLRRVMSCWPSPLCLSLSVSLCLSFSLSLSLFPGLGRALIRATLDKVILASFVVLFHTFFGARFWHRSWGHFWWFLELFLNTFWRRNGFGEAKFDFMKIGVSHKREQCF